MSLLDLQTMELPQESSDETVLGSGQSQHCSDSSWVFC
ncbi:SapB/AmfS family lanthipeptide [Streptomyces sp. HD1123-B1]